MAIPLYLRIGYDKCASTTLRDNFFTKHSGLNHLGAPYDSGSPVFLLLTNLLGGMHVNWQEKEFDFAYCRDLFEEHIKSQLENGKPVTITNGGIASHTFGRHRQMADRINQVFGGCRILVVIRNQIDLLLSMYTHGRYGLHKYNVDFAPWIKDELHLGENYADVLDYNSMANSYIEIFGKENVLILTVEELKESVELFNHRWCGFLGVDEVEGLELMKLPQQNIAVSRLFTATEGKPMLRKMHQTLRQIIPQSLIAKAKSIDLGSSITKSHKPKINDTLRNELVNAFRESNRKAVAIYNLPLDRYHYPS